LAPKSYRLYLDQMFRVHVADALRTAGYNVMRASEVGQARADDDRILQQAIAENRILITLDEHYHPVIISSKKAKWISTR